MKICAAVLWLTTLAGCVVNPSNKTLIVLQHPETAQTVQCSSRPGATWNPNAELESSVKAYEKTGL